MNFKQKMLEELQQCGLNEDDANQVMLVSMNKDDSFNGRWCEVLTAYPPVMTVIMWHSVKADALAYCEEHMPEAWFKPVFYTRDRQIAEGIVKATPKEIAEAKLQG